MTTKLLFAVYTFLARRLNRRLGYTPVPGAMAHAVRWGTAGVE